MVTPTPPGGHHHPRTGRLYYDGESSLGAFFGSLYMVLILMGLYLGAEGHWASAVLPWAAVVVLMGLRSWLARRRRRREPPPPTDHLRA